MPINHIAADSNCKALEMDGVSTEELFSVKEGVTYKYD